ncbi:MAG: hypothetical protein ACRD1I_06790 [Terriglobia bacterium]
MKSHRALILALVLAAISAAGARAQQQRAALSATEVDKLRDTQDPTERIKVYLGLMQARLTTFESYRSRPADPQYRTGKFLNEVLGQYIDLDDELKDWIQFQYNRSGDMRGGLHALLDRAPHQLQELQHAQQTPDPFVAKYSDTLQDAVADLEDTLNGATSALNSQEKKLGELKRNEKVAKKASQSEIKEEKKRIKEEEKIRKREENKNQRPSGSTADNN